MIRLVVSLSAQILTIWEGENLMTSYRISTAKNGAGECFGSEQTPRGLHIIRAKIGSGCPINSVFVARRPTGEIYSPALAESFPGRDWVLTRILWLSGTEKYKNRLGKVDTMRRFIYIHGTYDEDSLGKPVSKGCIRMRNDEVIELFDRIKTGTQVLIQEN